MKGALDFMKKMLKRLCTGFLALATVVTALPTTKKVTVFRCSDHSNFLSLYKGKQMLIDKIFFS